MTEHRSVMRWACALAVCVGASSASAQTTGGTSTPPSTTTPSSTATPPSTTTSPGGGTTTTTSTGGSSSTTTTTSGSSGATPTTLSSGGASATPHHAPASTVSTTTPGMTAPTPAPPPPHEGDGRDVDFLWIEAFGGISNVNLVAFSGNNTFSGSSPDGVFNQVSGTGGMGGLGLGFRVYWIAVGARATYAAYDRFQIGTVGGEVALRLPIPVVEPYARVGFGYAWQGSANYTMTSPTGGMVMPTTTVYGWAFNAAVGFDIFVTNWFTIGGGVGLDVLNMTRQSDPRATCMGVTAFCPMRAGDAVGYQLSGYAQVGFRF